MRWIFEVTRRFASVDKKTRSRSSGILAVVIVGFGVMSLLCVMSVMNGFQLSFIDAIMELSSYHVQAIAQRPTQNSQQPENFLEFCEGQKGIVSASPFYEVQSLAVGVKNRETACIVRAVDKNVCEIDSGFAKEINVVSGGFDLSTADSIVIGSGLAQNLGVHIGDKINLFAMSGSSDTELISEDRQFFVQGIFESGYFDINQAFCFVSLEAAKKYFGKNAKMSYGIKLENSNDDAYIMAILKNAFPEMSFQSWREYNRSFFGALRIEKNVLMLIVFLIFVVVLINIYNSMRRLVFERSTETALLNALGATKNEIRLIYILRGFLIGLVGSVFGLLLGTLISLNMKAVFGFLANAMYWAELLWTKIFSPADAAFVTENQMYSVYASIPAKIIPLEAFFIFALGILSPLVASLLASKNVLKVKTAEVLRNE